MTMTREEELQQFAEKETKGLYLDKHNLIMMVRAGAHWADSYPNWISVEDELPPENGKTQQSVSVWATDGLTSGEFRYNFDTKTWTDMWGDPFNITHWIQRPQLPRKEDKK